MKKKINIIGVGGRTGTMFAFELRKVAEILGVGKEQEVKKIEEGKVYIERKGESPQLFKEKVIRDIDLGKEFSLDFLFLTTKNPVSPSVKYYYQKFKEKMPDLLLSQNGIAALEETKETLKELFSLNSEKISLIRISLFNPVDKIEFENKILIRYSLPIRIAISKFSGQGEIGGIVRIFKEAGFEVKELPSKETKNQEFSKLFLNLIGMASASRGLSVGEGLKNPEIFKEEVEALKEYTKVIKKNGGRFLNFPHYPAKTLAILLNLPLTFLLPFRNLFSKFLIEGRERKPKDLDEIDYYNGAVVKLGKKLGIKTPINEKILKRVLEKF